MPLSSLQSLLHTVGLLLVTGRVTRTFHICYVWDTLLTYLYSCQYIYFGVFNQNWWKKSADAWDVINEPLSVSVITSYMPIHINNFTSNDDGTWRSDVFYDTLGTSFVPTALNAARAADPNTKLYINDYNIEGTGMSRLFIIWMSRTQRICRCKGYSYDKPRPTAEGRWCSRRWNRTSMSLHCRWTPCRYSREYGGHDCTRCWSAYARWYLIFIVLFPERPKIGCYHRTWYSHGIALHGCIAWATKDWLPNYHKHMQLCGGLHRCHYLGLHRQGRWPYNYPSCHSVNYSYSTLGFLQRSLAMVLHAHGMRWGYNSRCFVLVVYSLSFYRISSRSLHTMVLLLDSNLLCNIGIMSSRCDFPWPKIWRAGALFVFRECQQYSPYFDSYSKT